MERETVAARGVRDLTGIRVAYRSFAGYRTRVLEAGPRGRQATRLVLLHGYCDSADSWRPVLAGLAAVNVSVLAVDLPGFGEADPLRSGALLPQFDTFVNALLKAQWPYRGMVLAGHSLGATMSLRIARSPSRPISGVVAVAPPGFVDSWLVRTIGRYPLPLRLATSLPLPVPGFVVRGVAAQVIPRLLYADPVGAEAEQIRRLASLFPDYRSATGRLRQSRQLWQEIDDAYQNLERVNAPSLLVAGGKDRIVPLGASRRLHALMPHSRLLIRSEWGHCPQLDDPTGLTETLISFTAEQTGRQGSGHDRTG